jgi:flavorubredoxin/flavin reductase (DIM6/NTAB) family NADH-FMN oxidoreductase RutF
MHNTRKVLDDLLWVGADDRRLFCFEGVYDVPNGVSYNSYLLLDEKTVLFDTCDHAVEVQFLENVAYGLGDRKLDYLVVHHMEPDHAATLEALYQRHPEVTIVCNGKIAALISQCFDTDMSQHIKTVSEGDTLSTGRHELTFVNAPMVHWPEVMMTYEETDKILFSADAFGSFGALNGRLFADEVNFMQDWIDEARRYYTNIVGKYGPQVQAVLKKAAGLEIKTICPLHGPVLTGDLSPYLKLYDTWSSYGVETDGIAIFYTSVYGHTKAAVELLANKLKENGCPKVVVNDLAREDMAECVEDAFRYGRIVLATTTYNADVFPFMREFIHHLTERQFQNKTIAMIENGSWAPQAIRTMKAMLEKSKNITYTENNVKIMSALNDESKAQVDALAKELCQDYLAQKDDTANKNDLTALFNIGYGLYVVTSNDGKKDNGLIVNTVTQVTNTPNRIAVTINKQNYSHHVIKQTGVMNVNCLSVEAPFKVFENFGFQSGRNVDKFANCENILRSDNGLIFLPKYINSFMSLKVEDYIDLDTHGMFICSVTESRVLTDKETMTYTYYQKNVKPKPETEGKKGFVCKVCGYVYEGDELPDDIVCPLCKHGAADFEPIG